MKKRLLFVNGHLNIGGVERSLVDLLKNIDYEKYDVDLILFEDLGDYYKEIPSNINLIFYDLNKTYGSFIKCVTNNIKNKEFFYLYIKLIFTAEKFLGPKIKYLLKPLFKNLGKYDCAIAYRIGICTDFVGYVIKSNKKITWWHHGSFDYNEKETNNIRNVYKKFDYIVSVSKGCKSMIEQKIKGINNKVKVIPNIIDFNGIRLKSNDSIKDYIDSSYINIVSIGRLSPEKGMINCISTCKMLINNGYKVQWFLIGDGVERERIENEINLQGMSEHIQLLGNKLNPYPYLKKADLYVHPSYIESMSITVLESISIEVPVVVAKSIGPSEFICNEENGMLVEATPQGLFYGIDKVLKDKTLYEKLSRKNQELLNNYSSDVILKRIYDLIENQESES